VVEEEVGSSFPQPNSVAVAVFVGQVSILWGDQVPLLLKPSQARTLIPIGANGVALWSKRPCRNSWANSHGFNRAPRSRFPVSSICCRAISHGMSGKALSVVHIVAMKWF
jgi:hypothetical protein